MKILFPIGSFYPAQVGGPSNTIYWIAKTLAVQSIAVTVVTTSKGIDPNRIHFNKWKKMNNVDVIYHDFKFWQLPFSFLKSTIDAIERNDVVILSSFFYLPSIISAQASAFKGKRIIISPRGEFSNSALKYKSLSKKIRLFFVKKSIGKKIVFHSTCPQETKDIKMIFPHNDIFEIPNFIELPEKKKIKVKNQFLFLGRLHSIKALENLIKGLALSEIFRESDYEFLFVGEEAEPGYKKKLFNLVQLHNLENKIKFLGPITGELKQELLAQSKFLFLVSNSENFGNVVMEALAQGTPAVTSKGTPWSILKESNCGFWIENSPAEIKKITEEIILLDPEHYLAIREKAFKLALQKFDIENNINQWIVALDELMATEIQNS